MKASSFLGSKQTNVVFVVVTEKSIHFVNLNNNIVVNNILLQKSWYVLRLNIAIKFVKLSYNNKCVVLVTFVFRKINNIGIFCA